MLPVHQSSYCYISSHYFKGQLHAYIWRQKSGIFQLYFNCSSQRQCIEDCMTVTYWKFNSGYLPSRTSLRFNTSFKNTLCPSQAR